MGKNLSDEVRKYVQLGKEMTEQISREIPMRLKACLDGRGVSCQWYEESRIISYDLDLKPPFSRTVGWFRVDGDEFVSNLLYPVRVNMGKKEEKKALLRYLMPVNRCLPYGQFRLNPETGKIRIRMRILCSMAIPAPEIIHLTVSIPARILSLCGDGMLAVLAGTKTPEEAAEAIEGDLYEAYAPLREMGPDRDFFFLPR